MVDHFCKIYNLSVNKYCRELDIDVYKYPSTKLFDLIFETLVKTFKA